MTAIIAKTCALAIFAGAMANAATTTSTTLTVNKRDGTVDRVGGIRAGKTLTNFGSGPLSASVTQATPAISANFYDHAFGRRDHRHDVVAAIAVSSRVGIRFGHGHRRRRAVTPARPARSPRLAARAAISGAAITLELFRAPAASR